LQVIAHACTRTSGVPQTSLRFASGADLADTPLRLDQRDLVWVDIVHPKLET
jgi:hypothetical protein